jgi:hypothetical protein
MIRYLLALLMLLAPLPAAAESMTSPMSETGWSFAGGTATGSNVRSLKMLHQMTSYVKEGHWYRITGTVSGYSGSGSLRAFAGITMPSAPTGSWVTAASVPDVPDDFTLLDALDDTGYFAPVDYTDDPSDIDGPGNSAEVGGSMRLFCVHGKHGYFDPLVYPGVPGAGHLHSFMGNTGINANSTYETLRSTGSSSCQNMRIDPDKPVNRTGMWFPSMLDGHGNVIMPGEGLIYYKGPSSPSLDYTGATVPDAQYECTEGSDAFAIANPLTSDGNPNVVCPNVPRGMRFVFGYNKATGDGRPDMPVYSTNDANHGDNGTGTVPSGTQGNIDFSTWTGDGTQIQLSANFHTIADAMANCTTNPTQCPIGGKLHVALGAPYCWDGVHVDSPDHRAHLRYGQLPTTHVGNIKCPSTHPYHIQQFSLQIKYTIDQAFIDGDWRLSIDEMVDGLPAGAGAHMDYWEAWSPAARNLWFTYCNLAHNSCTNDIGNGYFIRKPRDWDDLTITGHDGPCNSCFKARPDRYTPTTEYGMSWSLPTSGAFSVDVRAPGDGVWGLMGKDGFNGAIGSLTITEIAPPTATGS